MRKSDTVRSATLLASMPTEQEALRRCSPIEMPKATIINDQVVFEQTNGFNSAIEIGFFLLRIPDNVCLDSGDLFASNFFRAKEGDGLDKFRGFRDIKISANYQGYFDREHDQWENFYIEAANWDLLPTEIRILGQQMTDIGVIVLRDTLARLGVPSRLWSKATSGLSDREGHQMLAFNHFRSSKLVRGSKFHRDSGWVTILRSTEPGLLALVGNKLSAINPVPGFFIVNFGSSMEVFTRNCNPSIRANIHGVAQTQRKIGQQDRTSYTIFLDSDLSGTIYTLDNDNLVPLQTVADFAIQEVQRTYDDDNTQL